MLRTLGFVVFLLIACSAQTPEPRPPPIAVPALDLDAYDGIWYEMASSPFVKAVWQPGCKCVYANYTRKPDGSIGVVNNCYRGPGNVTKTPARLYNPNPSAPGENKVVFTFFGVSKEWDYWVVYLSSQKDGQYKYAAVSEPSRQQLWILSRTPTMPYYSYWWITRMLYRNGFNAGDIIPSSQANCTYDY